MTEVLSWRERSLRYIKQDVYLFEQSDYVPLGELVVDTPMLEAERKWRPPASVAETLERGLDWARDEKRWHSGAWLGDTTLPTAAGQAPDDLASRMCENVAACAMAILVLCSYDGPLLRALLVNEKDAEVMQEIAEADPMIAGAALLLAAALTVNDPAFDDYDDMDGTLSTFDTPSDAIQRVISINDRTCSRQHHRLIVSGFKTALAYERDRSKSTP